jgi:hypothetical protein
VIYDFPAIPDTTVRPRCACRCGAPITDRSPSASFASEACARRWHAGNWSAEAIRAALQEAARAAFELFAEVARGLAAQARVLAEWAQTAGLCGPAAPDDPMQRALWLRRNRNTGPRPLRRAPRRLDPGGGVASLPLGRGPYRRIR